MLVYFSFAVADGVDFVVDSGRFYLPLAELNVKLFHGVLRLFQRETSHCKMKGSKGRIQVSGFVEQQSLS